LLMLFSVAPSSTSRLRSLVNSQLVCLLPVGILNLVMFIWKLIYHCLFVLVLKSPNGEWPIKYTYVHTYNTGPVDLLCYLYFRISTGKGTQVTSSHGWKQCKRGYLRIKQKGFPKSRWPLLVGASQISFKYLLLILNCLHYLGSYCTLQKRTTMYTYLHN